MISSIETPVRGNFVIFHPYFSAVSEVAFGHALKIALQAKAKLDIMHVEAHQRPEKPTGLISRQCEPLWRDGKSCLPVFGGKKSPKPGFV